MKLNQNLSKFSRVFYVHNFNWPPYKISCDCTLAMVPSFCCTSFIAVILFYGKSIDFPTSQDRKPQTHYKADSLNYKCVYMYAGTMPFYLFIFASTVCLSVYVFVAEIRNPLSVDKNKAIKQLMIHSGIVFYSLDYFSSLT